MMGIERELKDAAASLERWALAPVAPLIFASLITRRVPETICSVPLYSRCSGAFLHL